MDSPGGAAPSAGHGHGFDGGWPFPDPENVAAICCVHVLDGAPILRVSHDEEDGCWQILCGFAHDEEGSARVVCLGCMAKREPSLLGLGDLPLGWGADREGPGADWKRAPNDAPA